MCRLSCLSLVSWVSRNGFRQQPAGPLLVLDGVGVARGQVPTVPAIDTTEGTEGTTVTRASRLEHPPVVRLFPRRLGTHNLHLRCFEYGAVAASCPNTRGRQRKRNMAGKLVLSHCRRGFHSVGFAAGRSSWPLSPFALAAPPRCPDVGCSAPAC